MREWIGSAVILVVLMISAAILSGCASVGRMGYFFVQSEGSRGYSCSLSTSGFADVVVVTVPTVEAATDACKKFNAVVLEYDPVVLVP